MRAKSFSSAGRGYPPHKHDEDHPADEVVLEDVYYRTPTDPAGAIRPAWAALEPDPRVPLVTLEGRRR